MDLRGRQQFPDAHEIIPGVYLGNYKFAKNGPLLKSLKITHVINCAKETQQGLPRIDRIEYKILPLDDHPSENISQYFQPTIEYIDNVIQNGGRIVIHCYAGISRSATILIAYLMYKFKYTPEETTERVRKLRSIVNPNSGFKTQLQQYHTWLYNSWNSKNVGMEIDM